MSNHRIVSKEQIGKEIIADKKEIKSAQHVGRLVKLAPPPQPPVKVGDVENPLIGNKGLKRAMAVAIAHEVLGKDGVPDMAKAAALIRASGILYKSGYSYENPTDELTASEWSGMGYARFTIKEVGKIYAEKEPDKFNRCKPFAHALAKAYREELKKLKEVEA